MLDEGRSSRLAVRDDAAPGREWVGTLDVRTLLAAIADGKVFVRHDTKSIAVLALPPALCDACSEKPRPGATRFNTRGDSPPCQLQPSRQRQRPLLVRLAQKQGLRRWR